MQHNVGHRPTSAPGRCRPVIVVEAGKNAIEFVPLLIESGDNGVHSGGR
jgi:hypothetical protein